MPHAAPDAFKPKNQAVEKAFYPVVNPTYRNPRKVCKYCTKEMDHNTTNLQKHLDKCKLYCEGKPPDESRGSQQTLPILVAAMPQTKADHWKSVSSGVSSAATVGVRHEAAPRSSRIGLSVASERMISSHRPDLP